MDADYHVVISIEWPIDVVFPDACLKVSQNCLKDDSLDGSGAVKH